MPTRLRVCALQEDIDAYMKKEGSAEAALEKLQRFYRCTACRRPPWPHPPRPVPSHCPHAHRSPLPPPAPRAPPYPTANTHAPCMPMARVLPRSACKMIEQRLTQKKAKFKVKIPEIEATYNSLRQMEAQSVRAPPSPAKSKCAARGW